MRAQSHLLRRLPAREREIAALVFSEGEISAAEVARALLQPISNSAVRSMLRRLEAKGILQHRREGNRFIYLPANSEAEERAVVLKRVAHEHFQGSIEKMVREARKLIQVSSRARSA